MIGSPSGEIGIGPLISWRTPSSLSSGMRSAAGTAIFSKRSKLPAKSSRPKSNDTPRSPNGTVLSSQPPTAKPPTSGFK